jgi:type II secretory ATPase GspE/PulE/Tfp pilus assembly ATPase PilB-like protein/CheY-like chemotaxis protein
MTTHWLLPIVTRAGHALPAGACPADGAKITEVWEWACSADGLTPEALANLVAAHFRLAEARFETAEAPAVKLVPERVARQFHVFPLREDDRRLVVATSDPTDVEAEQMLGFASGRTPVFVVGPPPRIESAINAAYAPDRAVEALLRTVDAEGADSVSVVEDAEGEAVGAQEASAGPVVQLASALLREAIQQRASDIHLEPGRSGGMVRFRVDGVMLPYMQLPMPVLNRVISRIKILSRLDIADRLRPQDGRTRVRVGERLYDLRVSTVPTREAEKAVIRVLDPAGAPTLSELGLPRQENEALRRLLEHRDGIVLVTGPTGSGKTTTLYAALRELAARPINIMTVEDPIEYELAGITQIQVERKRDVTFALALRAALRQDPDVILVGEIRDQETAEIAVRAAITGHLVLGTLHANDALAAVARLADLGVDRALIASALRGSVAQRLVRRVCPTCARRVDGPPTDAQEVRLAERYGGWSVVESGGCEACAGTGFRGRVPVLEIATVTPELAAQIEHGAGAVELSRSARRAGLRRMREVALERVRAGLTTLAEVDRVLGEAMGEPGAPAAAEETARPGILLADDDAVSRSLARQLLERQGFAVAEAADGAAALAWLAQGTGFDLLVLDLSMPRVDGREVLRQVRATPRTAGLPVVVLTGEQQEAIEVELMEEGADDYIRKPFDPARFVVRIKAALRRAAS